jgi:hypothetical protein
MPVGGNAICDSGLFTQAPAEGDPTHSDMSRDTGALKHKVTGSSPVRPILQSTLKSPQSSRTTLATKPEPPAWFDSWPSGRW